MAKDIKKLTCWIISEGMAGTENQCISVAEALGIEPIIKRINLTFPWNLLSPYLGFETKITFKPNLLEPFPELVIASGRKAIAAANYIKKKSGKNTFTVYLQDPRTKHSKFDLIAVPFHDKIRGKNVITTDGAPNRITSEKLNDAKDKFFHIFKPLKSPRVAVLFGGNSKAYKLTTKTTKNICNQLSKLNTSLMITASRRTGEENLKIIQNKLDNGKNFIWNGNGENPYLGILSWADYIIVTADSTSMISDAVTTGKPTYIIPLEGGSKKFDTFHNHLRSLGVADIFKGSLEKYEYTPLQDAQKIAKEVKSRIKL